MTKLLTADLTYDAPLADVAAMLADPAFREEVCDAQRVARRTVTVTGTGTGREVVIEQAQAASAVPSFAKKLVGDEITIIQKERWTSETAATTELTIPGKPGQASGSVTLRADGERTIETVRMEITVKIPLVGGKVEELIHDLLQKALRVENRVGQAYLSR